MNYLQICQSTAQQSGTIHGVLPTTVAGQANRLKLIVDYVREAYLDIQNAHRKWRWLNSRFIGQTVAGQMFYQATSFNDELDSTPITRFSQWLFEQSGSDQGLSTFLGDDDFLTFRNGNGSRWAAGASIVGTGGGTATILQTTTVSGSFTSGSFAAGTATGYAQLGNVVGTFSANELITIAGIPPTQVNAISWPTTSPAAQAEEGALHFLDTDRFYETQGRGVHPPGKPNFYTLDNQNRLAVSPMPDAVYTLRGKYRKSAQYLTADSDIPEMPAEFHTLIKDAALVYLEGFDEGPRIPMYRLRMLPNFSMLEAHQLPRVTWGAPLA